MHFHSHMVFTGIRNHLITLPCDIFFNYILPMQLLKFLAIILNYILFYLMIFLVENTFYVVNIWSSKNYQKKNQSFDLTQPGFLTINMSKNGYKCLINTCMNYNLSVMMGNVTSLALGSQPRQGLAKVQAKKEARESHLMFLRV